VTAAVPSRLPPISGSELTDGAHDLLRGNLARADQYLTGAPDAPPIPPILELFARHPRVGAPWLSFSAALLDEGSLGDRDRELLILRVAFRTECEYLKAQHVPMARASGLGPTQLEAVGDFQVHDPWGERDQSLLEAADQLISQHTVEDSTWDRLAESFDEQQLLEILFVVGSYTCLSMVLNAVGLVTATEEDRTNLSTT
jgi:alkylhydroperoxidase family enzyme